MLKCCIGAFSWILLYLSLASFNKISCSHTVVPIVIIFLPSWFLMVKYQPTSFVKNLMRLFIELPIVAQWISFLPPWRKKKYFTIRHHQSVFTNANHDHLKQCSLHIEDPHLQQWLSRIKKKTHTSNGTHGLLRNTHSRLSSLYTSFLQCQKCHLWNQGVTLIMINYGKCSSLLELGDFRWWG